MESERIQCPMCGWARPVKYGVNKEGFPREVRFDKVNPEEVLIRRREKLSGAGRGSHNAQVELLDGKKLWELDPELKEQIRNQARKILELLE